jgi:ribonuclease D
MACPCEFRSPSVYGVIRPAQTRFVQRREGGRRVPVMVLWAAATPIVGAAAGEASHRATGREFALWLLFLKMTPSPVMIDAPEALLELVERGRLCESIAVDTEFVWDRTYYADLGLVQVALDGDTCFLLDTVALEDLSPFGELLAAPALTKILHDAPQDLTILRRATGGFPRNVFDTRCAAGLAGLSSTMSLGDLVAATVGVHLPKTESRTDWVRRPLTDEQVEYAAEDVCYLHAVRDELCRRIAALGRTSWLEEELSTLDDPEPYREREPWEQFQRVKGSGRASRRELAILRELAAWREEEARRCDRPRGRVVMDKTLMDVSRRKPRTIDALGSVQGLSRRYGTVVLELVERGLDTAEDDCPPRRSRRRPTDEELLEKQIADAMALLRARGEAASIDAPFMAARAEVNALVIAGSGADPAQHRLLRGWRREVVGDELLQMLQPPSA